MPLPLRRAILSALVVGEHERFSITVTQALDLALARAPSGPQPMLHLAEAQRLIEELESGLASPSAARLLRTWLENVAEARAILRASEPPSPPKTAPTRRANVLGARTIAATRPVVEDIRRRPGRPKRDLLAT